MKSFTLIFSILCVSGCASSTKTVSPVAVADPSPVYVSEPSYSSPLYQFISIEGNPYFLDSYTGVLYKVKRKEDGSFDIHEVAGRVGLKNVIH